MTFSLTPALFSLSQCWLQAEGWIQFPGLVHGFSGRLQNGNTKLDGSSLTLCTVRQVHGDDIVVIDRSSSVWNERSEADGMITADSNVLLGIVSADCVPVLIVAPQHGLVAALHAGWRGTLKGISARAVAMLQTTWHAAPTSLWVALGPAIGRCCYEIGAEVGEAMIQRWHLGDSAAWQPQGGKGFLDLRMVNLAQFVAVGVPRNQVQCVGPCTFCDSSRFASYRREGSAASRQLSVIGWQKKESLT